ncbi:hypothetical protein [Hymenobacter persicinus]|uniref:Uncharacterized protein n=1 Tax=Hymenobacter persicinus TaxID=2025506 RepID=A0A4Q5L8Z7_9BACT|nr:hypothetical protein [Hymenobacter persicinus]RYU78210.1 hypothetical protein EWM57_14710 [Hymenobacter persicinus]
MKASLVLRFAFLLFALTVLVPASPAAAADRSPYVRAVSKGRVVLHRPNYKVYRGSQPHGPLYRFFHR